MWWWRAVRFLSPYDLDLFLLMLIYSLCIHHLLFMEFMFLGSLDCFSLSSLKSIAFFLITSPLTQCHFHSCLPVWPTSRLHIVCAVQVSDADVKKKGGGRNNGRTRFVVVSQNLLWWAARMKGSCLCSPLSVLFLLLRSVLLTTRVWCLPLIQLCQGTKKALSEQFILHTAVGFNLNHCLVHISPCS